MDKGFYAGSHCVRLVPDGENDRDEWPRLMTLPVWKRREVHERDVFVAGEEEDEEGLGAEEYVDCE